MRIVPAEECELAKPIPDGAASAPALFVWLGQAGFLIRLRSGSIVIDPYLSDSLAKKYRGARFPHKRMMPPPVRPEELTDLAAVLCTHAHTDHMDPETLPVLAAMNPDCRFVVPRAAVATAVSRGVPADRIVAINAGEQASPAPGLRVDAIPSAHEEFKTDEQGNHYFLGYVLSDGQTVIYHSGDCVPYPGLACELAKRNVQVALLPVNGRDEYRRTNGVPGNFTWDEVTALCGEAQVGSLIACHFGMFDFNTVDEQWLDKQITKTSDSLPCVRPEPGRVYRLEAMP